MSYIVYARKYRPQIFDEITGQSHITTTLKNALSHDRVAHAYLFAGPRGVGKTTTARILAKALNCEKGPTPKPCNACPTCLEITKGMSLDILEIDGASNRGIDEIRNLRDNVKFSPTKGKFKVYIIDEVHMLTAEAFNALLKTLEEPPPHVKFIFATTQAHKVPATILSRCQRFDFRRISTKDIADNLRMIKKSESLNIDDEAIDLIARYSDGGMRNGQVIMDQMMSSAKGKVAAKDVVKVLGVVDDEVFFGFSEAIRTKDAGAALLLIDRLMNDGKDVSQVVTGLIGHFRNISVVKVSKEDAHLLDAGTEKIKRYSVEAGHFTIEMILYVIYTLSNTMDFIRKSGIARIPLEAAMIKLTRCGSMVSLDEILKRLEGLGCERAEVKKDAAAEARPLNNPEKNTPENSTRDEALSENIEDVHVSWKAIIEHLKIKKISVASFLQEGYPMKKEGRTLTIGFPSDLKFHKEALETQDNRRLIEESVSAVLKTDYKIAFELVEPSNVKKPDTSDYPGNVQNTAFGKKPSADNSQVDPVVKAALDMFGGSIAAKEEPR